MITTATATTTVITIDLSENKPALTANARPSKAGRFACAGFWANNRAERERRVPFSQRCGICRRKNLGAEEGTRTPTPLRVRGPEPRASANSATSAQYMSQAGIARPAALLSLANAACCVNLRRANSAPAKTGANPVFSGAESLLNERD